MDHSYQINQFKTKWQLIHSIVIYLNRMRLNIIRCFHQIVTLNLKHTKMTCLVFQIQLDIRIIWQEVYLGLKQIPLNKITLILPKRVLISLINSFNLIHKKLCLNQIYILKIQLILETNNQYKDFQLKIQVNNVSCLLKILP